MTNTPKLALPLLNLTDSMAAIPPAWKNQFTLMDAAVGMTICTSGTRPGTPWAGQMIFETDTLRSRIWDASNTWTLIDSVGLGWLSTSTGSLNYSAATEQFVVTKSFAIQFNRKYRIHVEGRLDYSASGASNVTTELHLRGNTNGAAVTTGNPILAGCFADQTSRIVPFAFEGLMTLNVNAATAAVALSAVTTGMSGSTTCTIDRLDIYDLGTGVL